MREGRLAKAMWLAVLVPLFLAAVLPDQVRTLVCRFSGAVMDEHCCPPGAYQAAVETEALLRDQSCCSTRTVSRARLVSDRRVEPATPRHYQLAVRAPNMGDWKQAATPAGLALIRYVAPHVGPPIVLLKRAFLI